MTDPVSDMENEGAPSPPDQDEGRMKAGCKR